MAELKAKIGLEVHVHLTSLKTKLFCSCPADYVNLDPNTDICPVCLGLPGAIPVLNQEALNKALMVTLALNCEYPSYLTFTRKHYFYPDMAKNYQISQYDGPGSLAIAKNGRLNIGDKVIRIRRINIEEDPAKTIYPTGSMLTSTYTLLDYNRSGMGMLEIVTEPDIETSKEAKLFLDRLKSILEHLGVCDCEIEGSMRADVNISVEGGERVEVKNVGSPKDVKDVIEYEVARQRAAILQGQKVPRETRHWDSSRKVTVSSRAKETDEDYRYFPDPDLPPLEIKQELVNDIKKSLPELPDARVERIIKQYGITKYNATVLVMDKALADLFEETAKTYTDYEKLSNLIINDYLRWINDKNLKLNQSKATPAHLSQLLDLLDKGVITIKIVKEILPIVIMEGKMPSQIVESMGLTVVSDEKLIEGIIEETLKNEPEIVQKVKKDPKVANYLVGVVMKKTGKRADPKLVNEIVRRKLNL
ncbi:Asp-tRNA(Asn)/Glu-tRNA(Gln) amidotransferase subunit GatB [Metallosphaera hakonensis]|uniref:Aspartyl/glutamyl-tRNA(Asn/Gln) amidotransferase subunit B n=1 Tax=Metallosphaera hakonensis JCM 8857 = DSM 7519 TaxID=1293036 RepID=A0A2U9IX76_9CREN|nr:Asp-tRNA(Asn)/Glu-tRNA(Gln) amidotransferase subunit GatB [Metallosphaera hakonensis]AWS00617.1 Asp-tRNA(Asn)/Glu-tRNA(Gln) amidotransferase subunit GatB [Metallosphaera hakonensis JCM 8857 = DSM 7519]